MADSERQMLDCSPCVQNPHLNACVREKTERKRRPWNRRGRYQGAKKMGHLGHECRREDHLGAENTIQSESGLVERALGEEGEKEQSIAT